MNWAETKKVLEHHGISGLPDARWQTSINLRRVDLSGAELKDARLSRADLSGATLSCATLAGADLKDTRLSDANLSRADLTHANLSRADLFGAILSRTNLSGADLTHATLSCANLVGATLSGANLSRVDLSSADLSGASLVGANLVGANLTRADLSGTCLDPAAAANGDVAQFSPDSAREGYVIGYRTRRAGHVGQYLDGRTYSADWFSVAETGCHPGLYLWPTLDTAREYALSMYSGSDADEIIKVSAPAEHVHRAGAKWRCRWFSVIGAAEKEKANNV